MSLLKRQYDQAFDLRPFTRSIRPYRYGSMRTYAPAPRSIAYRRPAYPIRRFNRFRSGRPMLNSPAGRVERKFLDNVFESGTLQFDTTGTVTAINAMAQGTTQSTRIGNKITMKSVYIRYRVTNGAASIAATMFRVLIVYDTQTNAATPALGDILQAGPADPTLRMMNLANRDRFKILYEDTFTPVGTVVSDTSATTEWQEYRTRFININLDTIFNNTSGGTVADIQTGGLFLVTMSNFPTGANEPLGVATTRIRYVDY